MNLLLLGKGYVGSQLYGYLKKTNTVHFVSRAEVNYASKIEFLKYVKSVEPDAIINCSGYTGAPNVDACEHNKSDCWFYNVIAPFNVAQVADICNVPVLHVSSGCIYTGYEKEFLETDEPNFGLYSNDSSYYSKTKHAFETITKNYNIHIFRIRMPFDGTTHPKNYLYKLYKYDNLISLPNSLTSMPDFCKFVSKFLHNLNVQTPGVYNVANTGGVRASDITELFQQHNIHNPNWKFISIEDLKTVAKRSNCVLSTSKITSLGLHFTDLKQSLLQSVLQLASQIKK